ncbi:hypothetical protein KCP73_21200 [Salmonella enterica subsp. enterica]|nr:hypothetical protein KCP73_21200 [Salmonella enterica subsp. enterica]
MAIFIPCCSHVSECISANPRLRCASDDAAEFCRAYQRNDDACGDAAEPV